MNTPTDSVRYDKLFAIIEDHAFHFASGDTPDFVALYDKIEEYVKSREAAAREDTAEKIYREFADEWGKGIIKADMSAAQVTGGLTRLLRRIANTYDTELATLTEGKGEDELG